LVPNHHQSIDRSLRKFLYWAIAVGDGNSAIGVFYGAGVEQAINVLGIVSATFSEELHCK